MNINFNKPPDSQGANRSAHQPAQNAQKPAATEHKEQASHARQVVPEDKVQISDRSKQVADIKSSVNQLPDVRDAKVQQIKASVDNGSYTVDPRAIAQSILKSL
jgi:negative regulator of flagellin synthesis FlgM